ncbi:MAG: hypothetical protein PF590_02745 [Candidatus Delongbacteria bacterium]|nr:hypothetical protein [Candidatus Delongbacteria bacterium]
MSKTTKSVLKYYTINESKANKNRNFVAMTRYFLMTAMMFCILNSFDSEAQHLVLFHSENIRTSDSVYQLKHVPVIPNNFHLYYENGKPVKQSAYHLDFFTGQLYLPQEIQNKNLVAKYRSYPVDISNTTTSGFPFKTEKNDSVQPLSKPGSNNFYHPGDLRQSTTKKSKLKTSGSIARGINVGNNQNAVLNSNLNLQIDGELSKNLHVRASLTDKNIPIQADGTKQNLQKFDNVFVEIYNPDFNLKAGDISLTAKEDYFMRYDKNTRGIHINTVLGKNTNTTIHSDVSASVSRGKYHKMEFMGEEGNQGPYKLQGAENETYIVVVSGSERVFIDGELMTRGQTQDYIIDYNTGEISFTSNQLITKDSRIIVEFEYRTSSYNRMMIGTNHEIKTEKSRFFIRYFNESDGKNQPLDQSIGTDKRQFLSTIGDNLSSALYPSWDSIGYESSRVRYCLTDTTVNAQAYDSVFVYSTHPDSAVYQVNFSNVGANNGNYIKLNDATNGRVFKWVAPKNGIPSGNYEPVTHLTTPKKQQMLSLGGAYDLTSTTEVFCQVTLSDKDLNTYSDLDSRDDQGLALRSGIKQQLLKDSVHNLQFKLAYDFIQRNFTRLERFRETEFTRNWNIENELPSDMNEHSGQFNLTYSAFEKLNVDFRSAMIDRPGEYTGGRNQLNGSYRSESWDILLNGDLLNTRQTGYESFFMKNNATIGKLFPRWQWYGRYKQEWQEGYFAGDSLASNSFRFHELETWLKQGRQSEHNWKLGYKYRLDALPLQNELTGSSEAQSVDVNYRLLTTGNNNLDAGLQYRNLTVLRESEFNDTKAQDNFAGQVRYHHESFNGFLSGNLFYQSGAGLELKKEYSYLKVPDGQGVYTWTDYNNNGIEELDEFEVAVYQDQADYIRIYIPGNEYIKTFNNSMNFSFDVRPDRLIDDPEGFTAMLSKLSNRFNMNFSDKNTSTQNKLRYLPVSYFIPDSSLVFYNNSLRNVFSWDRLSSVFTTDLIYQRQDNRSQLVNGEESRQSETWKIQWRWNISRVVSISNTSGLRTKIYDSQFFSRKNYHINEENVLIDLRIQPDVNMRIRSFCDFSHRRDELSGEFSRSISPGVEYRNNALINGMLSARVEYIRVHYSGDTGTSLAWQMLESLEPGDNYRWTLSFQKRLSNGLQLNLNYQGRKPAGQQTIHTGGVQLRAYF